MHLLADAVSQGVNLQTHTPVHKLSETADDDGYWTVETERGAIKAKNVIIATNAYTGGLLPEYTPCVTPYKGVCSRIVPNYEPTSKPEAESGGARWRPMQGDYYGIRGDGSLIVGGAYETLRCAGQAQPGWDGVFDDSELICCAEGYFDDWAEWRLQGWEKADARADWVWSGIMAVSGPPFFFTHVLFCWPHGLVHRPEGKGVFGGSVANG